MNRRAMIVDGGKQLQNCSSVTESPIQKCCRVYEDENDVVIVIVTNAEGIEGQQV